MNQAETVRDKFIESIGTLGEGLGLNRAVCQIYALLYICPEPLSPTAISQALRMSKGNVSINMKKLEEWNAVKKVWRKGYSRSLYQANGNLEEIILEKLKSGMEKRTRQLRDSLNEIAKAIRRSGKNRRSRELTRHYHGRLSQLQGLLKKADFLAQNFRLLNSLLSK